MDRVTLPGWLVFVLCAGLVCSLLGLAYMLGRESGRTTAPAADPPQVARGAPSAPASEPSSLPTVSAPAVTLTAAPAPVREPRATSASVPPARPVVTRDVPSAPVRTGEIQPRTSVVVNPRRAATPAAVDAAEREAVVAYFARVDNVQPGSFSGSPEEMAQEILNGAASGDLSGIDRMLSQARAAETAARAITPPAPCREIHQESLHILHESVQMLEALRGALANGDVARLQSFQSHAAAMKTRTETLERKQQAIRARYGVPAARHG